MKLARFSRIGYFALVLFFGLGVAFFSQPLANLILSKAWQGVGLLSSWHLDLKKVQELANENEELRLMNISLESKQSQLQNIERDLRDLREIVGISDRKKDSFALGQLKYFSRSAYSSQGFIEILSSQLRLIKPGSAVTTPSGYLVGLVQEIANNGVVMQLLDDPKVLVSAISSVSKIRGVVKYQAPELVFITPQSEALPAIDERIITYQDPLIPSDLVIAAVVRRLGEATFENASLLRPLLSPTEINFLLIALNL